MHHPWQKLSDLVVTGLEQPLQFSSWSAIGEKARAYEGTCCRAPCFWSPWACLIA